MLKTGYMLLHIAVITSNIDNHKNDNCYMYLSHCRSWNRSVNMSFIIGARAKQNHINKCTIY